MAPLDSALGNLRAPLESRKDDLYETPAVAVESLLRVEPLPKQIWEPACGPGAIARVLRSHGHEVLASDLVDYNSPDQDHTGWDFLLERRLPSNIQAIVTNPPFKNAAEFVARAMLLRVPKIVMLLRLAFLESEARSPILDNGQLARVHLYRKRLPMMHRAGWEGRKASSGMAFAWFVWERRGNQIGYPATELRRISWEDA